MKRFGKIEGNFLEQFILELRHKERKTIAQIAEIIQKEKNINISREAVRNFINKKSQHDNN